MIGESRVRRHSHYQEHRQELLQKQHEYYQKNREQILKRNSTDAVKKQKAEYAREYHHAHKDELNRQSREYHHAHPKAIKKRKQQYYKDNKEHLTQAKKKFDQARPTYSHDYYMKNRERIQAKNKRFNRKQTEAAIRHYTNGKMSCACCSITGLPFLTFDHIHGDGAAHRKRKHYGRIGAWLVRNGFPSGFQVLCFNCNCAKRDNDVCPHQEAKNGD